MTSFKSKPEETDSIPKGIPYIIGNEAAERFSYYGMRAILVVYMTQWLVNSTGQPDVMSESEAQGYFHLFISAVYIMPIFGALLSDALLGKFKTIIGLSIIYCLGHLALAADETRLGLVLGLSLIAIGAGGIKPCVSAHVGDQFGLLNRHLMANVFSWFYFSINLGAFLSMLVIPWLLVEYGSHMAFAVPGILMLLATIIFWSGRYKFVHIPANANLLRDLINFESIKPLLKIAGIYLMIAMFWSLFEQIGSSWVLQAQKMDRQILGVELLPSQIQAANPLLILILTPVFSYVIYPRVNLIITVTPLRKMNAGLFLTVAAFAIPALIQMQLDRNQIVSIVWQLPAYVLLTSAEIMVSITCLEFSYTQAPASMKALVMALYFMSISLGNLFTSFVNFFIDHQYTGYTLKGADYFWFFTLIMLITAILFWIVTRVLGKHFEDDNWST